MKDISKEKIDILFVSNFSENLTLTESRIIDYLPNNLKSRILTYKKSNIKNTYSYEEFLEENYDYVNNFDIDAFNKKYQAINLNFIILVERFISDYYMLDGTLGHKNYSFGELNFIVKSWILFLDPFIGNAKIVFSGYADNMISYMAFLLSEYNNKKCISFGPKNVINNETNYLVDNIYAKPCHELINDNEKKSATELLSYVKNFNIKKQLERAYKRNKGIDKPIFGIFSSNIKKKSFWNYLIFGHDIEDKKIKKYLELDRVNVYSKIYSYVKKSLNIMCSKIYMKFSNEALPSSRIIYFPLQVQPEASTSVTSPYFMNLLSTVEYLSKSLPFGHTLVVKEHPAINGMRGMLFYKKIQSLPNVILMNTNYNAKDIMKRSEVTIGFGGTTLLESIYLGKKIFIFEDTFYSDSRLVRKLKDFRNLNKELLDFIDMDLSETDKEYELEKMLNYFYQRGFPRYIDFEKNMAINLMKIYNENS